MRAMVAAVLMVGAAVPAAASADARWSGKGQVEYVLEHKFHHVVGTSTEPEVRLAVDDAGLKVMARAAVSSFKSGNGNRDAHALEVLDAAHFPLVVVKGVAPGFKLPETPGTIHVPLQVEVELHGVTVTHPVDVALHVRDAGHADATFEFPESLTAHHIERPSLMMIQVDDALVIRGRVELERATP